MISQSGTFYKIVVTCLLLGIGDFSNGSPLGFSRRAYRYFDPYYYHHYPPSRPVNRNRRVFFHQPNDLAGAASSVYYGDGAVASHQLPGFLTPRGHVLDFMNIRPGRGANPNINHYLRAPANIAHTDVLETAAQSYFIEPERPTTTTQRPTFTKRKTRRPITVLAEEQKKAPVVNENNEIFQGIPVHFNPFRQIVNTSFGRSRPSATTSDAKQGRSRHRPSVHKAVNQETGSVATNPPTTSAIDSSLNEIPSVTFQGEPPRPHGRRRPNPEGRATTTLSAPTTTFAFDNAPLPERPVPRRHPGRNPPVNKHIHETGLDTRNINSKGDSGTGLPPPPSQPRARNLVKRPRTTSTASSYDISSEELEQPQRIIRPSRPFNISRINHKPSFVSRGQVATSSPVQGSYESPAPAAHRRRPGRPTTTQEAPPVTTIIVATEPPMFIKVGQVIDVETRPTIREAKQGFVLRPRPTQSQQSVPERLTENEIPVTSRPGRRRRKRPTTTSSSVAFREVNPALSYNNQEFFGAAVAPPFPKTLVNEHSGSGRGVRRHPPPRGLSRVVATPSSARRSVTRAPTYEIQEEQPILQPVRNSGKLLRNPVAAEVAGTYPEAIPVSGPTLTGLSSLSRRPVSTLSPEIPPIQTFNNPFTTPQPIDPNDFINSMIPQPPQPNLSDLYQFDNVLGGSSSVQTAVERKPQQPANNQFSSRSNFQPDEPEISDSDFVLPAASTERETTVSSTSTPITTTPTEDIQDSSKPEAETEKPLSPIERLQKNRQVAAKRLLARKPVDKTTSSSPGSNSQKPGSNARKHIIPPRMLRPRGKSSPQPEQLSSDNKDDATPEAGAAPVSTTTGNNETDHAPVSSDAELNSIPSSEQEPSTSRRPSLLENVKRRRLLPLPAGNKAPSANSNLQQAPKIPKFTPTTPPSQISEASSQQPTCEEGERYSKFLKKCVATYKPKSQG